MHLSSSVSYKTLPPKVCIEKTEWNAIDRTSSKSEHIDYVSIKLEIWLPTLPMTTVLNTVLFCSTLMENLSYDSIETEN